MGNLTANFDKADFQCRCSACAKNELRPATKDEVVQAVQHLRDRLGTPLRVTRGVSCEAHNRAIGGAEDSRHLPQHADAVDVFTADSIHAMAVVAEAIQIPTFKTFLVEAGHVHLDARPGFRRFLASPELKPETP